MIGVLYIVLRPRLVGRVASACEPLTWPRARRVTVAVFALTAAGWVFAAPLARALGIAADIDSVVAIAAVVALLSLGALDWPQLERRAHWDVLVPLGVVAFVVFLTELVSNTAVAAAAFLAFG